MTRRRADVYGRDGIALLTAEEAAARDREARERAGVPERVLMENAGRSAALVLDRLFPRGRVVAAIGAGNNGGDALVLLRTLRAWGRQVGAVFLGSREPDPGLAHGFEIPRIDAGRAEAAFAAADVLVDGILGTGARGAPRDPAAAIIAEMNASGRPILALDVPSGVDPTTGAVPGAAVRATATVAFGWPKHGLMLPPGRERCGRLLNLEIAFPPSTSGRRADRSSAPADDVEIHASAALLSPGWVAARLPDRSAAAHKGEAGRVLVAAGSFGMGGAAVIAARGAVRAGAGLVYAVSSDANRALIQTRVPEAIFVDVRADLPAFAERAQSVVIGPGLGTGPESERDLAAVLEATEERPTVLDADALNILAPAGDRLIRLAAARPLVLTPHPGEFARLTGRAIDEVRAEPIDAARSLARDTGAVVLLKGMPSVVAAPGSPVLVNTVGSSDLATAGMGDLLAGAIGAFLAGAAAPRTAAALGLFYTARAADLLDRGRSLTPLDAAEALPAAFDEPGASASTLGLPFVSFEQPPRW